MLEKENEFEKKTEKVNHQNADNWEILKVLDNIFTATLPKLKTTVDFRRNLAKNSTNIYKDFT